LGCGESDITILQVHHIKPFAKGGSNKPTNLSVLCPNCHQRAEKGLIKPTPISDVEKLSRRHEEDEARSKVEQHHITGPNVGVGSARDVHIHQTPQSSTQPQRRSDDDWDVDAGFKLQPDEYRSFSLRLGVGEKLSGLVEADDDVSCWVLGPNSLQSLEDGDDFIPFWEEEDITKVRVSFVPKSGHKFFFVIYRDEEEEDEVSVSVKLRTAKPDT
jgi:HNH endonuclease